MRGALLLALTVVLAGCALPGAPGTAAPPADDGTATGADTPTTPTVDSDNPWRTETLTVAVRTGEDDDRHYRPLVQEAVDFWGGNAERYAGYPMAFELVDDPAGADVVVSFVPAVHDCGNVSDAAGCAPVPRVGDHLPRPQLIRVRTGLSNASTVEVLKHEFGHALGLTHADEPQPLMAPAASLTTLPQPNASDRAMPWKDPELSVYVDYGNASDPAGAREQVGHALAYYEGGADGTVPDNLTFTTTRNRSAADVVVRFGEHACGQERGSCANRGGVDPDGDGAVEYYTRVEITLAGIDTDATAWHVARWLGFAMGFSEAEDWPAPLRDATYEERRSDWWK